MCRDDDPDNPDNYHMPEADENVFGDLAREQVTTQWIKTGHIVICSSSSRTLTNYAKLWKRTERKSVGGPFASCRLFFLTS